MSRSVATFFAATLMACGGGTKEPAAKPPIDTPIQASLDIRDAAASPPPPASSEAPLPLPPKLSIEDARKKGMRDYVLAMTTRDPIKVASCYSVNGTLRVIGFPELVGPAGIVPWYTQLFDAIPDYASKATRTLVNGDRVVIQWIFTGTQKGAIFAFPPTSKKVGVQGADVITFNPDGKIIAHHAYWDMATVLGQMGVLPGKVEPVPGLPTTPPENVEASGDAKNVAIAKASVASKTDATYTVEDAFTAGDLVVVEHSFTKNDAKLNKSFTSRGLEVVELKGGKVVKGQSYTSKFDIGRQLDLIKAN